MNVECVCMLRTSNFLENEKATILFKQILIIPQIELQN